MSKQNTHKPDFICIGPTKTGTSWLWTVLRHHPEIWLPPISEINFYWGMGRRIRGQNALQTFKQKIKGDIRIKWRRTYAKERWRHYQLHADQRNWHNIAWDLKYLFLPQNPSWYTSLFRTDKVAGDITGGYFNLDDLAIQRLARHLPDVKIIMSFRDPVSRLWSEAKMILLHLPGKSFTQVSEKDFINRFERAHQRMPSYLGLYQRWCRHFPKDQVMMCYYDDLVIDPDSYISRICNFIQVSDFINPTMQEAMRKRVFEGPRIDLPDHLRQHLAEKTFACVEELATATGHHHPQQWLKEYQQILNAPKA